ncbi:MAG: DUF1499 domain-containing protein [Anderseniella sp.]|jgi:uncharacterized protein (DUF1499 family)|nr:DUF1499 domain-containing protein [Anderseniella sp.]
MKFLYAAATIMLVVAVILLAGRDRIWAVAFGPADLGPVDFATLELKPSPNQHLVCPPGLCAATPNAAAPGFAVPEQALRKAIIVSWGAMDGTRQVAGSPDPSSGEIRFVQYSKWLGFPDTISVSTFPIDDGTSTLAIYSRSQVGESDLGVNARRVTDWLAALPVPSND